VLIRHRILHGRHKARIRGPFLICDVTFTPNDFKIDGFLILQRIWEAWKWVTSCLFSQWDGCKIGFDFANNSIW
jgi:hypothetical protein